MASGRSPCIRLPIAASANTLGTVFSVRGSGFLSSNARAARIRPQRLHSTLRNVRVASQQISRSHRAMHARPKQHLMDQGIGAAVSATLVAVFYSVHAGKFEESSSTARMCPHSAICAASVAMHGLATFRP